MRDAFVQLKIVEPDIAAQALAGELGLPYVDLADMLPEDDDGGELARDGRVIEMLSEHTLMGWLEGYLLSGRHGFFHTYEAFAHVIDSMFNQHAKWLDICKNHVPWRASV